MHSLIFFMWYVFIRCLPLPGRLSDLRILQWTPQNSPTANFEWRRKQSKNQINIHKCALLIHSVMLTLCNPTGSSPPASSVHGMLQARIAEPIAISYFVGSSRTRDWTCVSSGTCIGRQILYHCTTWGIRYQ